MNSVKRAPQYSLQRVITANMVPANLGRGDGINLAHYKVACVQVFPLLTPPADENSLTVKTVGATGSPAMDIYFWNEQLGIWIKPSPALSVAAPGAGKSYEYTFDVNGRIFLPSVTGVGAGEAVAIFVAGFQNYEMD